MKQIVIRCDASQAIGSGHVIRCRTLARELQRDDMHIVFLCRKEKGNLNSVLKKEFHVIELEQHRISTEDIINESGRNAHSPGYDQIADAEDCIAELMSSGIKEIDWIIVDHYKFDKDWESYMVKKLKKNRGPKILAIDDLADRYHHADLLLDQNFFGKQTYERYRLLTPNNCKQLLGPRYAVLTREYAELHPLMPTREHIQRVLIYFGAVDSKNLTSKALKALMNPSLKLLSVDVVIGRSSPHRKEIENLVAKRELTTLHEPMGSLAALTARADVAIGAGGTSTW